MMIKKLQSLTVSAICLLFTQQAAAQSEATFYTSMGNFTVQLYDTITPITAGNFKTLVGQKFYDGITFHRVINNFMIQGGDPNGNGTGGPGYSIPDEFDTRASNVQKTISMANSGPNTGGSQFFINLKDNLGLDYDKAPLTSKHAVFGIVISGFNVVQNIGAVATNTNDKPLTNVVMDSIRMTKFPASVSQPITTSALKIYPNPTTGIFNIDLPETTTDVAVSDIAGKVFFSTQTELQTKLTVDMTGKPKGIYLVRITNTAGTSYGRIVVQ